MHDVEPGDPARTDRPALPDQVELQSAILTMVRASQGIEANALEDAMFERFGLDPEDPDADGLVGDALEELVDELGVLTWITGDRTVHVADLVTGAAFTHVLSEREIELAALHGGLDLGALQRFDELHLPGGEPVDVWADGSGDAHWIGPHGWLDAFPVGAVLAVRIDAEGVFEIRVLDAEPAVDPTLAQRLRTAYDNRDDEPRLPVNGEDLALELLLEQPRTFAEPVASLTALASAAGLVVHGFEAGHDESVWHNRRQMQRAWTVYMAFGGDERAAGPVLDVIEAADPPPGGPSPSDSELRRALAALRVDDVLGFITLELFERGDADTAANADAFVTSLRRVASRSIDVGVAELVAAAHAEARHDVLAAEQHLELAHQADPDNPVVIDRLAAYASDRGDAARAVRLWQQLPPSDAILDDLRSLEPFAAPMHRRLGRNEPCWCGSGRKYKQCHLGSTELPALADRVGWLARKAAAYLERRRGDATEDVIHVAAARADSEDDEGAIVEAMQDPLVLDLVLTEGGWFERFLEDRGPLLPDDEALLAASWLLVDRTVYEVTGVRPGRGVEVRDLRTGEQLHVRERTFSRSASTQGLVCARAVPDGESHQFVGGLFPVAPGRETDLLEVLDFGEPEEIAAWVAGQHRPPVLTTREGEPLGLE